VDTSTNYSATNKATFTYVVSAKLTLATTGGGSISPNYSNAVLEVGKTYSMTATPATGFAFQYWGGSVLSNKATLSFVMASNLTFIANFVDGQPPVDVVTYPAVGANVSNLLIVVRGKATDNFGVSNVWYQVNGSTWAMPDTFDGSNWTASVTLSPAANRISTFAVDFAGNISPTNTVNFNDLATGFAPASLAGQVGMVTQGGKTPFLISFGVSTFSKSATDTNDTANVGNYSYNRLGANTAQFSHNSVWPDMSDAGVVSLTFTNPSTALFASDGGSTGVIVFAASPNLVPAWLNGLTVQHMDGNNNTNTTYFGNGTFTNSDGSSGNCVFSQFSPIAGMLQQQFTDSVNTGTVGFVQLTFATTNTGNFFSTSVDTLGNQSVNTGPFAVISTTNLPVGRAPLTLSGHAVRVTPSGQVPFNVTFGLSTLSQFNTDTNNNSNVGFYGYVATGPNTGALLIHDVYPPNQTNDTTVDLTFTSASSGVFTNANGKDFGTVSVTTAASTAPVSLAGKTLVGSRNGKSVTFIFNADGTFTQSSSSGNSSGNYLFEQFSPTDGMLVLNYTDQADAGTINYIQLSFASTGGGSAMVSNFDSGGILTDYFPASFSIR